MKRLFYTIAILFAWFQMAAQSYTYDNLNRLTCVEYANGVTVTYTYDALGNRLRQVVNAAQAPAIRGDVNGDGVVDVDDLNIVINIMIRKATMERWPAADLDGNGVVDVDDLNLVINIMVRKAQFADHPAADVDGNGVVDVDDLNHIINIMVHKE